MGSLPLVAAKLAAPVPSGAFLDRERLYRTLDQGLDGAVTVVVGHAGAGKSALVAGWTTSRRSWIRRAWVNADAGDTSTRLLHHIGRAIAGPQSATGMEPTRSSLHADLHRAAGRQLVVVVDDVHLLRSRHAIDELGALAAEAPAHVHLVLISRSDPHVGSTWRTRTGDVLEVRGRDLRLTDDEVREIVGAQAEVAVDDASLAAITRKVDGWAAGLQLALEALARSADPAEMARTFGGATPAVADYLLDEVLAQMDRTERDLLLDVSVLDDLSESACRGATGREDAFAALVALADRNLLIERYTDDTLRCHPLLQQLLQIRLQQGDERRFARLHRLAAGGAEARGDLAAAVEHLLAGDDPRAVLALCRRHADDLVGTGGEPFLRDWVQRVPEHRIDDLDDQVDVADLLLASGDVIGCALRLERCRGALRDQPQPETSRRIDQLQGRCHHRLGDPEAALRCARRARSSATGGEPQVAVAEAFGLLWEGDVAGARAALGVGAAAPAAVLALGARVEAEAGDLPAATQLVRRALAADRAGSGSAPARLDAWLARTQVAVERMHEVDADASVEALIADARQLGARDVAVVGVCLRARLRWAQICVAAGVGALGHRSQLDLDRPLGALLQARLDRCEARLRIEAGELAEAHDLLDRLPSGPLTAVLRSRAWAAEGEVDRARDHLVGLRTERPTAPVALAWARVLADAGDPAAEQAVAELLVLPTTRHLRRTFLEEGERFEGVLRVVGDGGAALAADLDQARQRTAATTLSSRELSVLQFLPTRLTNQEIGAQLYVSANTVKTHLKNVYRRLGVGSRDEAVARARELGLLPPGRDHPTALTALAPVRAAGDRSPAAAASAPGR